MTDREPGRTGVVLRDPVAWGDELALVRAAEAGGYEAVFVPEIQSREAFTTLAGFAGATRTIRLGTGVVTIWNRTPATTAMAAATVHELSGGRMILGIGAGSPTGPAAQALTGRAGPARLVEDFAGTARSLLRGGTAPEGSLFASGRHRLDMDLPSPVPVWLAALGDRMVALAGRIADGVLLNWCTPERVAEAAGSVREAAGRAGRDPAGVTVAVYVRACLGVEEDVALRALGAMAATYASIPHYRRQFEAMGLGEEAAAAAAAGRGGRAGDASASLARALTVTGGRGEALARFAAYREAGADLVLCYPVATPDTFASVLGTVTLAAPVPLTQP